MGETLAAGGAAAPRKVRRNKNHIRHMDQLLKLERLHAIQWASGAGAAPHEDERWHPLYDKILKGGKGST